MYHHDLTFQSTFTSFYNEWSLLQKIHYKDLCSFSRSLSRNEILASRTRLMQNKKDRGRRDKVLFCSMVCGGVLLLGFGPTRPYSFFSCGALPYCQPQ